MMRACLQWDFEECKTCWSEWKILFSKIPAHTLHRSESSKRLLIHWRSYTHIMMKHVNAIEHYQYSMCWNSKTVLNLTFTNFGSLIHEIVNTYSPDSKRSTILEVIFRKQFLNILTFYRLIFFFIWNPLRIF